MRAGSMRDRIVIMSAKLSRLPSGAMKSTWEDVATVWAEVKGISGRERMTAGAETAQATVRVWIRFRVDVTASSRIRVLTGAYSGNELDIVGPPFPTVKGLVWKFFVKQVRHDDSRINHPGRSETPLPH